MSDTTISELIESKPRVGRRSQAYAKLAHLCVEEDLTDSQAMSILLRADNKWGKFKYRRDRQKRLQGIIDYARDRHN
jgi:hypothetical protein